MRLKIYNFLVNRHSGIRIRYHKAHDNSGPLGKCLVCWVGYLALLTYIVLFKGSWDETRSFLEMIRSGTALERRKVYLRPFESTGMFLELWEYSYARWNVMGNILLFIPFGALMRGFAKKMRGALASFGLSLSASLGFELIQLMYAIGEFDVDDIILNVFGALLGYILAHLACCLVKKWKGNKQSSEFPPQSLP